MVWSVKTFDVSTKLKFTPQLGFLKVHLFASYMREHIPLLISTPQLNESVREFVSASVCVCVE